MSRPGRREEAGRNEQAGRGEEADRGEQPGSSSEPEPRWLDPEERAAWLSLVGVMTRLPSALDAQLQRDAGLTLFEYMVLAMLSEQPDRTMRLSELAAITDASLSRLSHVATRLARQGFLRRETDEQDGRFTNAVLTPEGQAKVESSAPGHVAAVRELVVDPLTTPQLRGLRIAGEHILARVDPAGHCSS